MWNQIKTFLSKTKNWIIGFLLGIVGVLLLVVKGKDRKIVKQEKTIIDQETKSHVKDVEIGQERLATETKDKVAQSIIDTKTEEAEKLEELENAPDQLEFYNELIDGFNN